MINIFFRGAKVGIIFNLTSISCYLFLFLNPPIPFRGKIKFLSNGRLFPFERNLIGFGSCFRVE